MALWYVHGFTVYRAHAKTGATILPAGGAGLEHAMRKLEQQDPRRAKLSQLRFLASLTTTQAAKSLGVRVSTADKDWTCARCWLKLEMSGENES